MMMKKENTCDTRRDMVGVGLRDKHYGDMSRICSSVDFVEVHAENFFVEGGPALYLLERVRERVPVSLHATSLGLGGDSLTSTDLDDLERLVNRISPILVSDHACFSWTRHGSVLIHGGDLLPLAFNGHALDALCMNVDSVQQRLGRQLLIENLSSYLTPPGTTMREFEFLQKMCERTGAGLLLDINNLYVNAINRNESSPLTAVQAILDGITGKLVQEFHLAGSSPRQKGALLVDYHGAEVPEAVWKAYRYAISTIGVRPTLVEWDTQLPVCEVLLDQANKAGNEMEMCNG